MGEPPLSAGAVQERSIVVVPLAVAVRLVGAPGTVVGVVVSSSRIVMPLLPMAVPSRSAATVTVRGPSSVSFAVAVTVTSTEAVSFTRTTWWPAVFVSASPGLTL